MNINELKTLQLKIIKKNNLCNLIATIFILAILSITVIILLYNNINFQFIIISIFLELFISIIIIFVIKHVINQNDIQLFYKNYKNIFVLKALKNNFNNIVYNPAKGFDKQFVDEVGMLDTGDRYYSNDFISGSYKNIKFEQADVHIEEKHESTDSKGNTSTTYFLIFKGRLMVFDFNKRFNANIQVASKYFAAKSLPRDKKLTRVKMEDVEFNENFYVYAQSEHEAFYILTPHFIEKLKEVTNKFNCKVMFCFVDNRLHIALHNNKDSFEYNVFKVINEQEIEADIIKDIKVITDFVNELSLDNTLFRKEV